jgi:elongation of very long chain fatty acids protein 7
VSGGGGLIHKKDDVNDLLSDPRVDGYPLMSSPLPTIAIIALYIYFVKNLGPRLMKDRKPLELKGIITVFNLFQVAANLINVIVVS